METKFLVSLILLQAIFNNANLNIIPERQTARCGKNGNFNSDDLLKARDDAFNALDKSFRPPYNGVQTAGSYGVWTKALCPPYIKMEDCRECVKKTIPMLNNTCPKQKEGAGWSVAAKMYCMVRYADHPTLTNLGAEWVQFSPTPAALPPAPSTAAELEKGLNNLANKLKEAVNGNSEDKYGSGSISYGSGSGRTLYGSMQCYVTISKVDCMKCLSEATNLLHDCCSKLRKQSGRAFSINCAFWYAHFNFYTKTLPTIYVTPPHILG